MAEWIGRYRLLRPLGEGGMGRLFLAEVAGASGFSRRVVLKVVKDELDEELKRSLLDEARLQASLVHRNVVPVLDLEEADERRVVVLEHVDGIDLRQLLERQHRLPWPIAVFIASEVASGLDYAHRKTDGAGRPLGIVHRDVSPANILLSWEGEVKLTDFGVAKFARSRDGSLGALKGNLGYMAPEQARGDFVDATADLFALGVVLYEALTGDNPFRARTDLQTLASQIEAKVPPLAESFPSELRQIVARATAIDRRQRFASAAAMRQALVELAGQPADPARQLASFLDGARTQPKVRADALLEAVLGGGKPITQVKPIDTVKDAAPPASPAVGSSLTLSRGLLVAAVVLVFAVGSSLLLWRVQHDASSSPLPPSPTPSAAPAKAATTATPTPATTPTAATPPAPSFEPALVEKRRAARGSLSVNSIPWANVFVDGRHLGHTPRLNLPIDAGRHHLRLVTDRGDTRNQVVEIAGGKETKVTVNFAQP